MFAKINVVKVLTSLVFQEYFFQEFSKTPSQGWVGSGGSVNVINVLNFMNVTSVVLKPENVGWLAVFLGSKDFFLLLHGCLGSISIISNIARMKIFLG